MKERKVEMDTLVELVRLHRMGTKTHEVARLLGMSPNTERKYRTALEARGQLAGNPDELPEASVLRAIVNEELPVKAGPQQVSSVSDWEEVVVEKVKKGVGARAIYNYLCKEKEGFKGSYPAVKRLCRKLKRAQIRAEDVDIPVETDPGQVAQVDFGYVGYLYDPAQGKPRKAWVFVLVLGYSRHMFARVVFDQATATWLQLHVEAFTSLGGVPETLVPDNLKSAVVRAAFGVDGDSGLNRSYRELARYYHFKIDPCPPRAPEKKGKVESGVKYVKRSFFKAWEPKDIEEANQKLAMWLREVAGQRDHGTMHWKPLAVFEETEKKCLLPLPAMAFVPVVWKKARVHDDSHVEFDKRLWSVPWGWIRHDVYVRATPDWVAIYADDQRIADHDRRQPGPRMTHDGHLPEVREPWRHRSQEYWEKKASFLGTEVLDFIHQVFAADDVHLQIRPAISIVTLLENYPTERARNACVRASFYGNFTYRGIKEILLKGLDLEPLPERLFPDHGRLESPVYARSPQDFTTRLQQETPYGIQ